MDGVRDSDRWMALMGPLFVVLLVLAIALGAQTPSEDSTGQEVIDKLGDSGSGDLIAVFAAGPAVAALLIFVSWLGQLFGSGVGAPRRFMQHGAVVYGIGLLLNAVVSTAEAGAADDKRAAVAETLNRLEGSLWVPVVIGGAILLLGAGLSVLRSTLLPGWMGWVALVVGVISLLGPGGFLGFWVTPLWVAIAGILLFLRRDAAVARVERPS